MSRFGVLAGMVDRLPLEIAALGAEAGEADVLLLADRLDQAARKVRGMAPLFRNEFTGSVTSARRATGATSRRAA